MIVRILLWNIFDSKTTIDELRDGLPELPTPSEWVWSESGERFGLVAFGDDVPDGVTWARDLIGSDPDVYEEFDTLAA